MVGVSSRHGATTEIAHRIAARLRERGHTADVFRLDERPPIAAFDAFVIGSAVYMGQWRRSARRFVDRHHDELRGRPIFLFSSGPLEPDDVGIEQRRVDWLTTVLGALDHRLFAGALDESKLGPAEKAVIRMVDAETGDHRPWDEIDAWADEIADHLDRTTTPS